MPSGALRARVFVGRDKLTGRRHDLIEVIPAGRNARKEAEKARTRLLAQVDEKRTPRTRATVNQMLDKWLDVLDVQPSTRQGYVRKLDRHIRPVLGAIQVAKVDADLLEQFYATLRRCRVRCGGRQRLVDHRTERPHACDGRCGPPVPCRSGGQACADAPRPGPPSGAEAARVLNEVDRSMMGIGQRSRRAMPMSRADENAAASTAIRPPDVGGR